MPIPVRLHDLVRLLAAFGPAQPPAPMLQQRLRRIGIRPDLQTAAYAVRRKDAPEYEIAAQAAAACLPMSLR